ncbi:hypothetical protein ACFFKE_32310 [Streptomyces mutabilis]|uniref:hypothetical protein n=1 Tax=Streptomyces mutabilis TaxID=67332 RepID=UPI0017827647|nr:hypothetical protein [Streptomyces mutabilis]GGQ38463.1 hypothetical protein GCM10010279_54700 [Streptomyces mutabilis]
MEHRTDKAPKPPSPANAATEPLGDLVSGDAVHTNPATLRVRSWMTVDVAERLAAGADDRAAHTTAVTA